MTLPKFSDDISTCLYCNTTCIVDQESEWSRAFKVTKTSKWSCYFCKETFIIKGIEDEDPDSLSFTCKDITVYVRYKVNDIVISKKITDLVTIPNFNIDFSDKEKLYNKLSTYLLFS